MTKHKKQTILLYVIVTLLIAAAVLCRFLGKAGYHSKTAGILRSAIYLGLFSAWGISVRNRIIQPQIRRYLTAISALMVFWFIIRSVKFHFVSEVTAPDVKRCLWYMFYLPILFIPLLAVFVGVALGKPENYRMPRRFHLLCIPSALLFALVMTNDIHQLVFCFPPDAAVRSEADCSYGRGYLLVIGWIAVCTAAALAVMLVKCRVPRSRHVFILPFCPLAAAVLYGVIYVTEAPWLRTLAGDMTTVFCLLIAASIESCIKCGLILSNTHYRELFDASTIGAEITDEDYNILLSSAAAQHYPPELLRRTAESPVMADNGIRLSSAPIRGGYVIWSEDVSPLTEILNELSDAKDDLEDDNILLSEEYALKSREAHIAALDRLYDKIQHDTARQISLLAELTDEFEDSVCEEDKIKILGKMTVIGAYLKRRNNLIFLADRSPLLEAGELAFTFGESMDNLELYGVVCGFCSELTGSASAEHIMAMYDFFEDITERSLASMSAVNAVVGQTAEGIFIRVTTDSAADLFCLRSDNITVLRDEDGEWQLTFYPNGGESR